MILSIIESLNLVKMTLFCKKSFVRKNLRSEKNKGFSRKIIL